MFYVRDIVGTKYGLVDTQDGVVEYVEKADVDAADWCNPISINDFRKSANYNSYCSRVAKKLFTACKRETIEEFISKFSIPFIENNNHAVKILRYLNYIEDENLVLLFLGMSDSNRVIVKVSQYGSCLKLDVGRSAEMRYFSGGSGYRYNTVFERNGVYFELPDDGFYFMYYTKPGHIVLRNMYDFSVALETDISKPYLE